MLGTARQFPVSLYGVEPATQGSEYGGLEAGPGANFQDLHAVAQVQSLCHQSNRQRLADGLVMADRKCDVFIGLFPQGVGHEHFARHPFHGIYDFAVSYAALTQFQNQQSLAVFFEHLKDFLQLFQGSRMSEIRA